VGWLVAGCGGDTEVHKGEVVPVLKGLHGYNIKFRRVPLPEGADDVVAGRATGPRGAVVDFAVIVGDVGAFEEGSQEPAIPHMTSGTTGCANAETYFSTPPSGSSKAVVDESVEIEGAIQNRVDGLAKDITCLG
jgi:hypothetical protein